jgi:Domain of unknown function (DUF4337)
MSTAITTTPNTPPPPPPAPEKKSLWGTVITSTPVIMTVIATLFAGMSASEMTWAQYHRATAAQNQSKAGDQYNFFQAKRIRGTSLEMTSTMLRALAEPAEPNDFSAAALKQSAEQLADRMALAQQDLQRLADAARTLNANAGATNINTALARLQKSAESSLEEVKRLAEEAVKVRNETDKTLTGKDKDRLEAAFGYLKNGLPRVDDAAMSERPNLAAHADDIEALKKAIEERKPENDPEVRKLLRKLKEPILKAAYDLAVENSTRFDKAGNELKTPLGAISNLVEQQMHLALQLHRSVNKLNRAASEVAADESKAIKDLQVRAAALAQTDRLLKDEVEQLHRDFKAANIDFDVRRYGKEARYNLNAATLYELQVRKSNFESDRHMDRKTMLFYAMLTAQAGVTIATLALAFRRKSAIWGLAAMAGAAAIGFGGFVAMSM